MNTQIQIVNAFTDNDTGENPSGVLLDADGFKHRHYGCLDKWAHQKVA